MFFWFKTILRSQLYQIGFVHNIFFGALYVAMFIGKFNGSIFTQIIIVIIRLGQHNDEMPNI